MNNPRPNVLIVDDSVMDRQLAGVLIERCACDVSYAEDGLEALSQIRSVEPDVVLTDLRMPNVDGLQLVKQLRSSHPHIPVILMTGFGSEKIAAEALRVGATSYVPKHQLANELEEVVRDVLATTHDRRLTISEPAAVEPVSHFELAYQRDAIAPLVNRLQQSVTCLGFDEADLMRIGTALAEALNNAVDHGNLELDSSLRDDESGAYEKLREARMHEPPFCDRRVHVTCRVSKDEAIFVVRDEGPGFDPNQLRDPTAPENLNKSGGRGMLLIKTFMDEVKFNSGGNEITMVKRRHGS